MRAGGLTEIFALEPSGTVTQLTRNAAGDAAPAGSADGNWIAFVSARDGAWRCTAHGSQQERLTETGAAEINPDISPNGTAWCSSGNEGWPRTST